jgi:two-component system response regulator HupR/HoxA
MSDRGRAGLLVVSPEPRRRAAMARAAASDVFEAADRPAALRLLREQWIGVAALDSETDPAMAARLMRDVASQWPETVIVTAGAAPESAPAPFLALPEPLERDALAGAAAAAAAFFAIRRERDRLAACVNGFGAEAGPTAARRRCQAQGLGPFERIARRPDSPMEAVCRRAAQIACFDVPALLLGETGVGKELLAQAIHRTSLRSEKPFHAVHCGAIPDDLLESELFGHARGAFTGAHAARTGLLVRADGGTVFLDEIGDTSPAFQVKLLRFLQEGEVRPVGANDTIRVDVRVIAATNRDLEAEAKAGLFRADLFYRLGVCPLRVPPLRERPGDVPTVAERLLDSAMERHGKRVDGIEPAAMTRLCAHDWPGNVRELDNEITRLLMLAEDGRLAARDLSAALRALNPAANAPRAALTAAGGTLKDRVERLEAMVIRETLEALDGNKSRAAEALGLSRVGLRAKLARYGLCDEGAAAQAAE